jgi:hypothetical protein
MLTKVRTVRTTDESSAVLIVRLPYTQPAERVAHAAIEGGPRATEVTLSVPGAVGLIGRLAAKYGSKDVAAGAGAVLDDHAACRCISAGVSFLVSPQLNPEMIRVANRHKNSLPYAKAVPAPAAHLPTMLAGVPKDFSQPFRAHARDAAGSPLRHRRGRNPVRSPGRACDTAATPAVSRPRQERALSRDQGSRPTETSPGRNVEDTCAFDRVCICLGRGVNELTTS